MTKEGSLLACARIFKQSMGARNRVGLGLSYRPAKPHRLAKLIPWIRFLRFLSLHKSSALFAHAAVSACKVVAEFIYRSCLELKPA
jgi:hypothetical protein